MLVTGLPAAWVRQGYGETAVSSVCRKLPPSDRVGETNKDSYACNGELWTNGRWARDRTRQEDGANMLNRLNGLV